MSSRYRSSSKSDTAFMTNAKAEMKEFCETRLKETKESVQAKRRKQIQSMNEKFNEINSTIEKSSLEMKQVEEFVAETKSLRSKSTSIDETVGTLNSKLSSILKSLDLSKFVDDECESLRKELSTLEGK